MAVLSPEQTKTLAEAIGDRLDFDALGYILFKCAGDNKIAEIASRATPSRQIAKDCLTQAERDGVTLSFLAFSVDHLRQDTPFRDLVHATVPAVAEVRPTTKEAVNTIVAALFAAHALMGQPEIRAAIDASRDNLAQVQRSVIALGVYKSLHDELHKLQLRRFERLQEAAGFVGKGEILKVEPLHDFHYRLDITNGSLRDVVQPLDNGDIARTMQEQWIGKLATAAAMLQTALDDNDEAKAKLSLGIVQRILENEPTQINKVIFATARILPLQSLVQTLNDISAKAPPRDLASGAAQVAAVQVSLTAKVVEHQLWQEADDDLWTLGRVFLQPPLGVLKDFAQLWPLVRSKYKLLSGVESDQAWAQRVASYAGRIDDRLSILDGKLNQADTLVAGDIAPLQEMFDNFRAQVRLRFFHVDKELRAECTTLLEIETPINGILESLV